jgi:hypothetical protein
VTALRFLNTEQVNYMDKHHRFADRDQIQDYLREEAPQALRKLQIDLEDPKSYELAMTTSADGQHYQITLQHNSDPNDQNTRCQNAFFTDDAGLIYLGRPLGCDPESAAY